MTAPCSSASISADRQLRTSQPFSPWIVFAHCCEQDFEVVRLDDDFPPHSVGRVCSLRVLARKKPRAGQPIDKAQILRAYEARLAEETDKSRKSA